MKKLLKRAGLEAKQTVFLFTDTQIIHETFLEVGNTLNTWSSTQMVLSQKGTLHTCAARGHQSVPGVCMQCRCCITEHATLGVVVIALTGQS